VFEKHLLYRTLTAFYYEMPLGGKRVKAVLSIDDDVDTFGEILSDGHAAHWPIESFGDAIEVASEDHAQPKNIAEAVYGGFMSPSELDEYALTGKLPERFVELANA
jgi:hypothetical protein